MADDLLARDILATPQQLGELAERNWASETFVAIIAKHPNCDGALLERLCERDNLDGLTHPVTRQAARHANCHASLLTTLACHRDGPTRLAVARHDACPPAAQAILAESGNVVVARELAQSKVLTSQAASILAHLGDDSTNMELAGNRHTPKEALMALAVHTMDGPDDHIVRDNLLSNPASDADVIRTVWNHRGTGEDIDALGAVLVLLDGTPSEVIDELPAALVAYYAADRLVGISGDTTVDSMIDVLAIEFDGSVRELREACGHILAQQA
jgi:hypothetical protein